MKLDLGNASLVVSLVASAVIPSVSSKAVTVFKGTPRGGSLEAGEVHSVGGEGAVQLCNAWKYCQDPIWVDHRGIFED